MMLETDMSWFRATTKYAQEWNINGEKMTLGVSKK